MNIEYEILINERNIQIFCRVISTGKSILNNWNVKEVK